jgi:imidazolonepropionase-like amidohydrolase
VWTGHGDEAFDGVVVVGADGLVAAVHPAGGFAVPDAMRVVDCAWVGPGVTDAHVQFADVDPGRGRHSGGLVAARDFGSPSGRIAAWRSSTPIVIVSSGPMLVGVTSQSEPGTVAVVDNPASARRIVARLVSEDVDLLEVYVGSRVSGEPAPRARRAAGGGTAWAAWAWAAGGAEPLGLRAEGLAAVVDAAHAAGLPVVAYALSADAVRTALAAGVDELANVPVEQLPPPLVELVADAGVPVVSTLQRHAAAGPGAARNAVELHRAGVRLVYGTASPQGAADGTSTGVAGVDPRELDRLAFAGLGRLGALRAATSGAAKTAGLAGRAPPGHIEVGQRAALVGLCADPLIEPVAWRCPAVVVRGTAIC